MQKEFNVKIVSEGITTGCPQGLEKLEKGLVLENGLEKTEKHTARCPEAGKAGKSILWT